MHCACSGHASYRNPMPHSEQIDLRYLENILAVARKSMLLVEGNAVLMRAGIGFTLLKTEKESGASHA